MTVEKKAASMAVHSAASLAADLAESSAETKAAHWVALLAAQRAVRWDLQKVVNSVAY